MENDIFKKQLALLGIESAVAKPDTPKDYREKTREVALAVTKELMKTSDGRQWLYYVLDLCRTFNAPFVAGNSDISDFFAGAQAVGLKIFDDIMAVSPENFPIMLQEEKSRKIADASIKRPD